MTLRRTGDWGRKKPLQNRTPLSPGSGLSRRSPMPRTAALGVGEGLRSRPLSSARPKVSPEERRARKAVRARSGGMCEVCGRERATNWHHRIAKGRGGSWCPANGLDLCGSGSTGCHGLITTSPALAYERGWSVRTGQDPSRFPAWLAGKGFTYLRADGSTTPVQKEAA